MHRTSVGLEQGRSEAEFGGLDLAPPASSRSPSRRRWKAGVIEIKPLRDRHGAWLEIWLVLGEVAGVHLDPTFIREDMVDTAAMAPFAHCGRANCIGADELFAV